MKKRIISAALVPLMIGIGLMQSSCFGSFALTKKVYTAVDNIGPKDQTGGVIRTLIMYGIMMVPAIALVDILVLNLIEFWTGSNPIAMQEGEMEQQVIMYQGSEYLVTATKNEFKFEKMINGTAVEESTLQFCGEDQSWSYIKDGESQILTAFRGVDEKNNGTFDIYTAEGVKTVEGQLSI